MSIVRVDTEVLKEAVYELLQMQRIGQGVYGSLSLAVNELAQLQESGNFLELIVSNMKAADSNQTVSKTPTEYNDEFVYNNSFKKTEPKKKDKKKSNSQEIALQRILLKLQDLLHIIEVTQQLISRTEMDMKYTDEVIARMALELMLEDPSLDKETKDYISKNRRDVEEAISEDITEERETKEQAIKETTEKHSKGKQG